MKSTTDEILQEGIKAHKNGDLQNAERLYREILQFSPLHPDANHNLGLIAVSTNNSHASLPLFKTALSVNPKVEQFWVSYIEALATEHYLEEAAVAVERAKSEGFVSHKVESLSKKLSVLNLDHSQKPSPSMVDKDLAAGSNNSALMLSNCQGVGSFRQVNPPEQKLRQLLVVYQKGQFRTAEKLARSLIQQFPHHEFGWKVLCNILGQTGRIVEGAVVARKSVDLSPQDADSRMSLANMLKELGELDDACACYRIAIQLRPGNPEVFNNLGVTLKLMGKVEEAEIAFKQAISFGPNYAEPRYNAGLLAQELSNFKDAVAFFSEAIKIKPTYTSAHNNLLRCLYLTGQKSPFFAQLDYLISNQVVNSVVGSFTDRAALKYGVKRPNVYCQDPLDYVVHIDLTSRCLFQEDFIDKISSFKKAERSSARTQSLVENGSQTKGNIFQLDGHDLT
ncbi:MAG: tetratricopeptide repeat protein, partial [Porticoccaceae bacterium]|nr:tetratricopeptide repeat protein [Porticoccaceae bacterium]